MNAETVTQNDIDGLLNHFASLEINNYSHQIEEEDLYGFVGEYRMEGQSYRKETNEETLWKDVVIKIEGKKINGYGYSILRNKENFFIVIGMVTKWIDGYPYEIKFVKHHPELNHSIGYKGIIKEEAIAFYNNLSYGFLEFSININNVSITNLIYLFI